MENKMILDEVEDDLNWDEYDRRINALAERDDERWEDMD